MERISDSKTYADYIATRPRAERFGSHGLFTDDGMQVQLAKVSQELSNYSGHIYTMIASMRREDATRLGFDAGSRWRDFLRSQTQTISENLKIPMEHLRWYAAFHDEGHHPHIHMIAYSSVPGEGYLSDKGVERMRSVFAREIFSQELLHTYEHQTEVRDQLRELGRESVSEIVSRINNGGYSNTLVEELLIKLGERLSHTTGKKVYGYLKADVKAMVDQIVAELSQDENIGKLYNLWYEQREEILRTYTDHSPKRVPLEQNKEFKTIRNAVIQEAMKLHIQISEKPICQNLTEESEAAIALPLTSVWTAMYREEDPPEETHLELITGSADSGEEIQIREKNLIVAASATRLLQSLARMFAEKTHTQNKQRPHVDRKHNRELLEKKQALGIRD